MAKAGRKSRRLTTRTKGNGLGGGKWGAQLRAEKRGSSCAEEKDLGAERRTEEILFRQDRVSSQEALNAVLFVVY